MKKTLFTLFTFLLSRIPVPIKRILKFFHFHSLISILMDKGTAALAFQTGWVTEFIDNKHEVLKYWEQYRYLNEIRTIGRLIWYTPTISLQSLIWNIIV